MPAASTVWFYPCYCPPRRIHLKHAYLTICYSFCMGFVACFVSLRVDCLP